MKEKGDWVKWREVRIEVKKEKKEVNERKRINQSIGEGEEKRQGMEWRDEGRVEEKEKGKGSELNEEKKSSKRERKGKLNEMKRISHNRREKRSEIDKRWIIKYEALKLINEFRAIR